MIDVDIKYKRFFEMSLDLLCIASTDGHFKIVNPAFTKKLGYTDQELKARPFVDFVHEEDVENTLLEVQKLASGQPTINFLNRYRKKDGDYIYLHWTASPDTATGELFAVAHDITDLKLLELKQDEQLNLVEKANKELDHFAYIVSHDLKAPLRAIHSLSTFIEEDLGDDVDPDIASNMTLLRSRVERMQNLISGVLMYSRVGKGDTTKKMVDFSTVVQEVINNLEVPEGFTITVQPDMPSIEAVPIQTQQVFQNYLSNAIKYHDKKEGRIDVLYEKTEGFHQFAMKDDGPGIDPQYHEKVFGIFQSLQARDDVESTGIGLSIVKKLVEEWGGSVWIESDGKNGSTFLFTIPE